MAPRTWFTPAALAVLVLSGCAGANMNTYTPVNEKTKYDPNTLFAAARAAVEKLQLRLQTAEIDQHTLETREREVAISSVPRLSYKYTIHIKTLGGVLSIESSCTKNSATAEAEFKDCGGERPKQVLDEQEAIRKKTLELAPTAAGKNYDWSNFGKDLPPEPPPSEKPKAGKKKTSAK